MTQDKKGVNPLATGVAGAVIGAAAAAAAIILSDEKNRKKAKSILEDLQKNSDRILKEVTKKALELKDMGTKALLRPQVKETPSKKAKK